MTAQHSAQSMLHLLRRHYLPEGRAAGGLFADEIGAPDASRRADLIWVPTTVSGSFAERMVGHEVKVTRSDVMAELADPTKADAWLKFCDRWWLVVADPTLIEGLEVPAAWGVMAPPSGRRTRSMTIVRRAPKLTPTGDAMLALTRIVSFLVHRVETQADSLRYDLRHKTTEVERLTAQLREAQLAGRGGYVSPHVKRISALTAVVEAKLRDGHQWGVSPSDTEIADAIADIATVRARADRLASDCDEIVREVDRIVDPFRYLRADVAQRAARARDLATATIPARDDEIEVPA